MSDVAERVKKIVIEHLGVDAEKVVDMPISSKISALILLTPLSSSWLSKRSSASRFLTTPLKRS